MNIGVDLRALSGDTVSGVKVYLLSLLEAIFRLDKKNRYFLWWNSASETPETSQGLTALKIPKSPRFKLIHTKFSNRKLNLQLSLRGSPPLDRLILDAENRKEQLDVFWLPDPRPVALSENCKLVTTVHDLSPTLFPQFFSPKTRVWHKLLNPKKIARNSDYILAVSDSTKKDLQEVWGVPTSRITTTPLAASVRLTPQTSGGLTDAIRKKYNLPEKFIFSLSTLEPRKNLQTLIAAFREFKEETNFPHELVLAGSFDQKIFANPNLKKFKWLHFPGFIAEKDKAALFSTADLFCFPSFYEGFGIPPLEAMSCGVPVLTSDIPAIREVCGDAAKLLPSRNVDAWKVALQKILTNENLREEMSKRGLAQAKKFSWEKTAKKTIEVFESVKE